MRSLHISENLDLPLEAVTQTFAILAKRRPDPKALSTFADLDLISPGLTKRFCSKVTVTKSCWVWTGYKKNCYGSISVRNRDEYAHRLAYESMRGPLADGLVVLHSCDNPGCVNPDHLIGGTQIDNILDMRNKGRGVSPPVHRGATHPNASLSDLVVTNIRSDTMTSQRKLAAKYHVSQSTIWRIRHGITR